MLNFLKATTIILTLCSVLLVIYAIATSTYTSLSFWIAYFAVVITDLILINYMKKLNNPD